jgi:hypothetical protein
MHYTLEPAAEINDVHLTLKRWVSGP